uniref:Uncharacterized protein n=1 Tax=Aegilops tauschii subsp. strangulata TaxID=200361 RepID=A0A453IZ91_AEGTS
YAGDEWQIPLRGVTAGAAKVLRSITVEKAKILSIFIGLAAQMLPYMEPGELHARLAAARVVDTVLARTLVQVLREYSRPSMDVPRIRRYTIELAMAMMRLDARYVALFVELGMGSELRCVAGTTSQLECFNVFSGSVGLSRRATSVRSAVSLVCLSKTMALPSTETEQGLSSPAPMHHPPGAGSPGRRCKISSSMWSSTGSSFANLVPKAALLAVMFSASVRVSRRGSFLDVPSDAQ